MRLPRSSHPTTHNRALCLAPGPASATLRAQSRAPLLERTRAAARLACSHQRGFFLAAASPSPRSPSSRGSLSHPPALAQPRATARGEAIVNGRVGGAKYARAGPRRARVTSGCNRQPRSTAACECDAASPRQARAPDITHHSAMRDSAECMKRPRCRMARYVDWTLRRSPQPRSLEKPQARRPVTRACREDHR